MINSNFVQIDEQTRISNLVEVLDKRCRGFIKKDVLRSVVNRLDTSRQLEIEVVNEAVFKQYAQVSTYYYMTDGEVTATTSSWARCLLGSVEFGSKIVNKEKDIETVVSYEPAKIITSPAIIAVGVSQGSIDNNRFESKLIIYI